jgi:hypothetical protein
MSPIWIITGWGTGEYVPARVYGTKSPQLTVSNEAISLASLILTICNESNLVLIEYRKFFPLSLSILLTKDNIPFIISCLFGVLSLQDHRFFFYRDNNSFY